MTARETAIVFGVGPGLGLALARRFRDREYAGWRSRSRQS